MCRDLIRPRPEDVLGEMGDSPERGSQARQVRQRVNPEKVSELTSIRELLQEVAQDTHDGRRPVDEYKISPALSANSCLDTAASSPTYGRDSCSC